jgi:hypothetical protein
VRRLFVLLPILVVACSGGAGGAGAYQLGEFFINGPTTLSEDARAISVENGGAFPHTLVVSTRDGKVITATDLVAPGETAALDLALDPGTYQFTCRIVSQGSDGQLIDHFERGMHTTVAIGG